MKKIYQYGILDITLMNKRFKYFNFIGNIENINKDIHKIVNIVNDNLLIIYNYNI